jgi:hypothetical protein
VRSLNDPLRPEREIIGSEILIPKGRVTDHEGFRTTWSIVIAVFSLLLASLFLGVGIYENRNDVVTWATSLISGISGAAISYGFNSKSK